VVVSVFFTSLSTCQTYLGTELTKCRAEFRFTRHQGDAEPAKLNTFDTGFDACRHVFGVIKTLAGTFFTGDNTGLTGVYTGLLVRVHSNSLALLLFAKMAPRLSKLNAKPPDRTKNLGGIDMFPFLDGSVITSSLRCFWSYNASSELYDLQLSTIHRMPVSRSFPTSSKERIQLSWHRKC
jgi:hypothetical protein